MFKFTELKRPIVQAPMAGGPNTPALAAAVCEAGGMGSFGFAYSSPQRISDDLVDTQALTRGPINANFFVFQPVSEPNPQTLQNAVNDLLSLHNDAPYPVNAPSPPFYPDLQMQLEPVWQHRPAVLSFHFGIPNHQVLEQARALKIAVGITATNLTEAKAVEKAGAQFIVAQGIEAGGHRGVFHLNEHDEQLSTVQLVKQLSQRCNIPVVAAGAIMTGADIAEVISAGAVAAQMGTAFLCCNESGASPAHKSYLMTESQRGTQITCAFSGRPARGIRNAFMDQMQHKTYLPFPLQNSLTGPMRQWAGFQNNGEYQSLWAGTAYAKTRSLSATALMNTLAHELEQAQSL